jgi:hypothetical protein
MGNEPVVQLNNGQMLYTPLNQGTNWTVIAVSRYIGGSSLRVVSSLDVNWLLGHWSGGDNRAFFNGWVTQAGSASTTPYVYTGIGDGGTGFYYRNGVLQGSNGFSTGPARISLGGYATGSEKSDAQVAELMVFNRPLTQAERENIEDYLAGKYDISLGRGAASTNLSGNRSTCTATVTVEDNLAPTDNCSTANLAQGKSASSSSNNGRPAPLAVDGNTNGNYNAGSVFHSNQPNDPWWRVDLGQVYDIDRITLWNRTECCRERINGAYVMVSNNAFTNDPNLDIQRTDVSYLVLPSSANSFNPSYTFNNVDLYFR